MTSPIPLIVPGLRDHVAQHWQTLLSARLPHAHSLVPMGRDNLALGARIDDLEATMARLDAPVLLVAHSGGVIAAASHTHEDVGGEIKQVVMIVFFHGLKV